MKKKNTPPTPLKPVYIYDAKVLKVVDGDTVDLCISLGFYVTMTLRFRLGRINTAELTDTRADVKTLGLEAKKRLADLLKNPAVTIRSNKPYAADKYGRWLADIYLKDGTCVNDVLLSEGLAKLYPDKF